MSDNQKQEVAPWIKAPDGVVDVYANNFQVTWSLDDVRIRLAQLVSNPEKPTPGDRFQGANEERAAITFTWRIAKMLRNHLTQAIDGYEKINGEINIDIKLPPSPSSP
jgi:hypothetical protein